MCSMAAAPPASPGLTSARPRGPASSPPFARGSARPRRKPRESSAGEAPQPPFWVRAGRPRGAEIGVCRVAALLPRLLAVARSPLGRSWRRVGSLAVLRSPRPEGPREAALSCCGPAASRVSPGSLPDPPGTGGYEALGGISGEEPHFYSSRCKAISPGISIALNG